MADEDLVFVIDGADYPVPDVHQLTVSERTIAFDVGHWKREDFFRLPDEQEDEHDARVGAITSHPAFMESLLYIAYKRGNPRLTLEQIRKVMDNTVFSSTIEKWVDVEDDARPPDQDTTRPHDEPSLRSSDTPKKPSSDDSTRSSDQQGGQPETTGTRESDTPSPPSPETTSGISPLTI